MHRRNAIIILPLIAWSVASAPGDGGLEGTITDENGHPVAGAKVKAQHVVGRETFVADSAANGVYVLTGLRPGSYSLYVAKRGHCAVWIRQVTVAAGARTRRDVVLAADPPCPVR